MTIYYNPGEYGLQLVSSVDLEDGYGFDMTVVWREVGEARRFLVGRDSGGSCQSPFEGFSVESLEVVDPSNPRPQIESAMTKSYAYVPPSRVFQAVRTLVEAVEKEAGL